MNRSGILTLPYIQASTLQIQTFCIYKRAGSRNPPTLGWRVYTCQSQHYKFIPKVGLQRHQTSVWKLSRLAFCSESWKWESLNLWNRGLVSLGWPQPYHHPRRYLNYILRERYLHHIARPIVPRYRFAKILSLSPIQKDRPGHFLYHTQEAITGQPIPGLYLRLLHGVIVVVLPTSLAALVAWLGVFSFLL